MKVSVVTGAAQGGGLVAATLLARLEFHVMLTDLQDLDPQLARLRADGLRVERLSGDISSESFVQELAQRIARDHGAADVLVNNAGISMIASAEATTVAQWQRVMSVNLLGPFMLCKYFGAQMLSRGKGSIINVAS